MAEARDMTMWNGVSWLCLHAGASLFSKKRLTLADFHPLLASKKRVNLAALEAQAVELSKTLPAKLSEEEKLRRWKAFAGE